jgi:hypothetical protein
MHIKNNGNLIKRVSNLPSVSDHVIFHRVFPMILTVDEVDN